MYVNRFQSRLQLRLSRHVNECIWNTLAQSIRNMHLLADTPPSGRCGSGVRFVVKFESCPDANQCDWRLPAIAGSQGVYPLIAQSHAELANRSGAKCLLDTIVAQYYNVFTWVPLPLPPGFAGYVRDIRCAKRIKYWRVWACLIFPLPTMINAFRPSASLGGAAGSPGLTHKTSCSLHEGPA